MIVPMIVALVNGITMKQRDFYSGKEMGDIITWSKHGHRIKINHFMYRSKPNLVRTKLIRALFFNEPSNFPASPEYLGLQRPKDRISIG